MSSACTDEFLSHSVTEPHHSLTEHLKLVGDSADLLYKQAEFDTEGLAYYAGLLHDIGKVNPIYQRAFRMDSKSECDRELERLSKEYVRQHSIFSAWASKNLLKGIIDCDTISKIMVLVAGHHTRIRQNIQPSGPKEQLKQSRREIRTELDRFRTNLPEGHPLSKLAWDKCIDKFDRKMEFDIDLGEITDEKSNVYNYLEMSYAFSCLLQADRGSFRDWDASSFDMRLETDPLKNRKSQNATVPLGDLRSRFQKRVLEEFDPCRGISVINAPTGIGKTKVFLDIISRFADNPDVERVFYFSPLLALTEDFEGKVRKVTCESQRKEILAYNHLYAGSLVEKRENEEEVVRQKTASWDFEAESFNKKFTITTTLRLLMTIYSNKHADKLKLASFRNALLVVDEIQTIPKNILSNLKCVFECMYERMGTRFILVSATIPYEIADLKPVLGPSDDTKSEYLKATEKIISVVDHFDPVSMPVNRTLVMSNTRRKAVERYCEITRTHSGKDIRYVSSGIRKCDRKDIISKIGQDGYVLVSTQVVEAGVDISFSHIFRECAPLDNILQVMGRLNREGQDKDAKLVIYSTDGKHDPYSELEFKQTQKWLRKIKCSTDVYNILKEYYAEIYRKNNSNKDKTTKLNGYMAKMDFVKVWEQIKNTSEDHGRETVLVPTNEHEWDDVKKDMLRPNMNRQKMNRQKMQRYGSLTATLPYRLDESGKKDMFDPDLMEKNVLMPKKEYLDEIYDETLGLDIHYCNN